MLAPSSAYGALAYSLSEGKYTVEAMDAGVDRVQWLHFGLTGNYDSWRYWGSNIRVN